MLPVIEISLPAQLGSTSSNVPAFLAKLWKMVDNPDAGGSRVLGPGLDPDLLIIRGHVPPP